MKNSKKRYQIYSSFLISFRIIFRIRNLRIFYIWEVLTKFIYDKNMKYLRILLRIFIWGISEYRFFHILLYWFKFYICKNFIFVILYLEDINFRNYSEIFTKDVLKEVFIPSFFNKFLATCSFQFWIFYFLFCDILQNVFNFYMLSLVKIFFQ